MVACRLAQARQSVCILERGKRWRNCDFPTSLPDFLRRGLWNEGQSYGPFDYRPFDCLEVLQARGSVVVRSFTMGLVYARRWGTFYKRDDGRQHSTTARSILITLWQSKCWRSGPALAGQKRTPFSRPHSLPAGNRF